ncbi:serine protease [Xinfangfangia sp. CPCC 101601]|uniref:Serine protease n=1 Tax=Pseudogemmobacter lacusdianii TaxID=3069608 RepID=A0ABU0VW03_9RHOB|nr:serine protease [Xinfangfangia sp. CPCC 101601]MDQ2065934.1 serine protease [Xinfangfangia sp. CPCC 101601]
MRALFTALLLCIGFLSIAPRAQAQAWPDQPFDASTMSREDTATLQAALAFSGDYFGYADGVWNADAQTALEAWTLRVEKAKQPLYRHLSRLILALEDERVKNGWQLFYSDISNTSYLHPFELLETVENPDMVEFASADSGVSLIVRLTDQGQMQSVHDWFYNNAVNPDPYRYNDDKLWITMISLEGDLLAYARSDFHDGTWSTLSVVVTQDYFYHLNLMAASMMVGQGPASLLWTKGGVIDQVINGGSNAAPPTLASRESGPKDQVRRPLPPGVAASPPPPPEMPPASPPASGDGTVIAATKPEASAPPLLGTPGPATGSPEGAAAPAASPPAVIGIGSPGAPPAREPGHMPAASPGAATPEPPPTAPRAKVSGTLKGSGTGFYLAPTMLVTAAHVVEGCGAVAMIDGTALEIVAKDSSADLAVLSGATDVGAWLRLSALEVPKLGESVTALGYPYYTSLDQGLTVTSGNVSALRGIDGSSNRVMITAPVQPGNSGGPLLNPKGAVIGVVVSRVDDMAILEETGSLPQNMNFAVPSGPLLTFLAQNRITRPQGEGTGGAVTGGVPEGVANAVVPLHCYE